MERQAQARVFGLRWDKNSTYSLSLPLSLEREQIREQTRAPHETAWYTYVRTQSRTGLQYDRSQRPTYVDLARFKSPLCIRQNWEPRNFRLQNVWGSASFYIHTLQTLQNSAPPWFNDFCVEIVKLYYFILNIFKVHHWMKPREIFPYNMYKALHTLQLQNSAPLICGFLHGHCT